MRAFKFCALVGVFAVFAVACQSVPEDAVNAPANEAAAGNTAAGATADAASAPDANAPATEAVADQAQRRERPVPEAPRAEGDQLAELLASGDFLLLDVRRPDEIERLGTVEGYLNIPIEELADRLEEVPRDRPILTA
jgi:hypothetical protein